MYLKTIWFLISFIYSIYLCGSPTYSCWPPLECSMHLIVNTVNSVFIIIVNYFEFKLSIIHTPLKKNYKYQSLKMNLNTYSNTEF